MIARLGWCPRTTQEHAERALNDARASLANAHAHLIASQDIARRTDRAIQQNHLREAAEYSLIATKGDQHG